MEDEHAPLPASGKERAALRFQVCRVCGRTDVWPVAEGATRPLNAQRKRDSAQPQSRSASAIARSLNNVEANMLKRFVFIRSVLAVAITLTCFMPVRAQTRNSSGKPYAPPRMPDGHPSLQGNYDLATL